jgi:hypothetical protein
VSRVGCGNYKAIKILDEALGTLEIKSLKALANLPPATLAACKGVGVTTLFAAMSLLSSEGVDVEQWYDADTTFTSLKLQQKKLQAATELPRRRRRRAP